MYQGRRQENLFLKIRNVFESLFTRIFKTAFLRLFQIWNCLHWHNPNSFLKHQEDFLFKSNNDEKY